MSRIYTVKVSLSDKEKKVLVKAHTQAQAVKFVTKDLVKVNVSSQQDIVDLVGTGTQVQDATSEAE